GQLTGTVMPVVINLHFITANVDNQVIAGRPHFDPIDLAKKRIDVRLVHEALRHPQHQAPRAPVRQIKVEVEPALHELARVTFEIAPLVVVSEARRGDPRTRRNRSQRVLCCSVERSIDRLKFVILIFAHARGRFLGIGGQSPRVSAPSWASRPSSIANCDPASMFQTSSSRSDRPTMRAARWSVVSVTLPSFGSSRRPIWLREVFMRWARLLRDMFFSFIACSICHARTSLTAMASNSSRLPSSPRKSSSVVSLAVERITFFFLAILVSFIFQIHGAFGAPGQGHPPRSSGSS